MSFISEPGFFDRVDEAEDINLRHYQEESIEQLRQNKRDGKQSQILASMVGSGKTVMGAFLLRECWRKSRRGMFVVDRLNLLDQTSAVFDRYGIPHGVVQSGHSRYRPGELIQVASIQALARRGWPEAELIIADEVHVVYKTMTDKIKKQDAHIIGLTATPFTRGLGKHYQAIVNVTTGNKLTAEGFLVPFRVWAAAEPDMTGAKVVAGEWTDEEASKRSIKIVGDVVAEYKRHGEGGKAICFGVDVAHCEAMQHEFLTAGINAQLYTYRTEDEEREMMLREFRKPDSQIRILISVAALSRGFDVPDVTVILMCRPLKASFAEFIQVIGRGLRSHPGKTECRILDLAGNFMRHYPALLDFFADGVNSLDDGKPKPKALATTKPDRKPRKCPKCTAVFLAGPCCPQCGFVFATRSAVRHEQGELGGFDGSKAVYVGRMEKLRLLGELKWIADTKKYKFGWVVRMFQMFAHAKIKDFHAGPIIARPETMERVHRAMTHRKKKRKPATVKCAPARAYSEIDLFA